MCVCVCVCVCVCLCVCVCVDVHVCECSDMTHCDLFRSVLTKQLLHLNFTILDIHSKSVCYSYRVHTIHMVYLFIW